MHNVPDFDFHKLSSLWVKFMEIKNENQTMIEITVSYHNTQNQDNTKVTINAYSLK